MIDEGRVLWRLHSVTHEVALLQVEQAADDDRKLDPLWLRAIKYALITAAGSCADVATHLCEVEQWGTTPTDAGDAIRLLGEQGILSGSLVTAMRDAVALRDALVGQEADADEAAVAAMANPEHFDEFVTVVAEFVDSRAGEQTR